MHMVIRRIERATLQERVYRAIKQSVLRNELLPGETLSIDSLAENLGVSQTPVREALTRLSADRLVEYQRNKGFRVAPITESCVREIYEIRRLIEPYTVKIVTKRITKDGVLRDKLLGLEEIAKSLQARIGDGKGVHKTETEECLAVDLQLNDLLLEATDNSLLKDILDFVSGQSMRVRTFVEVALGALNPKVIVTITQEHLHIMESMLNGASDKAANAVKEHLTNAEKRTLDSIRLALKEHVLEKQAS